MDDDIADLITTTMNSHPDSVIILSSDHGVGQGFLFAETEVGKVEHKLPMLFMMMPNSLLDAHPELGEVLWDNQDKLFSMFDMYATLRHLPLYPKPPPSLPHVPNARSILTPLEGNRYIPIFTHDKLVRRCVAIFRILQRTRISLSLFLLSLRSLERRSRFRQSESSIGRSNETSPQRESRELAVRYPRAESNF